jgi:hypothetical protein
VIEILFAVDEDARKNLQLYPGQILDVFIQHETGRDNAPDSWQSSSRQSRQLAN